MRKNVIAILIGLISIIPYIITYVFFNYSISIYLFLIPYFIYQIYKFIIVIIEEKNNVTKEKAK